jgi:hypothetical protein
LPEKCYASPNIMQRFRLIAVGVTLLVVAIAANSPRLRASDAEGDLRSAKLNQLRDEILTTFEKSVVACSAFQGGSPGCVKKHFQKAYAWYVLQEKDFSIGPPGTPGPISK